MKTIFELNAYVWNEGEKDYDLIGLYESEDYQQVKKRYDGFTLTRDTPQVMIEMYDDFESERLEYAVLTEEGELRLKPGDPGF